MSTANQPIDPHSGSKYHRKVCGIGSLANYVVADVYQVLEAFGVTCPARQHAIKKLLCAGLRGKGDQLGDLTESLGCVLRAIELQTQREAMR